MTDGAACRLPIEEGSDLIETLTQDLAGDRGWVLASGTVADAEVRVAGGNVDPVRKMRGRVTLVSLSGPVGGPYQALVARGSRSGVEVLAGTLVHALAQDVHAVWLPFALPAILSSPASRPEGRPLEPPGGVSGWAAAAAAAAEAAREDDDEEPQYRPEPGDLVQHFKFGLCDVLKGSGDTLTIRDVRGPARIHQIRVDLLTVLPPGERDGKRLFKLVRKR
jgi:hypothetical protein